MSSATALLLMAVAGEVGGGASAGPLTAAQALSTYHALLDRAEGASTPRCGPRGSGADDQILVCGERREPSQRLPLPDERGPPPGPRVALPNEIPRAVDALGGFKCRLGCDQSRLPETIGKLIRIIRGEDPDG